MTIFKPGENCWKVARAESFDVLIDAENYFRAVRRAMASAQKRIILIGWDFDTRVRMYDTQNTVEGPLEIGDFIEWLIDRNPELQIYILQWNMGMLKMLGRGGTLLKLGRWHFHPRVHLKLDGAHPPGAAQHEKIIVIDRSTAFCGGIDITEERWDTRAHRDDEQRRKQPSGEDPGPWHDASTMIQGEAAEVFAELAQHRWQRATGNAPFSAAPPNPGQKSIASDPVLSDVNVAIARTRGQYEDQIEVREIEQLYCDIIAAAEDYIYIESQYFTSRKVAIALAKRLEAETGPEVILIMPSSVQGWLESQAMDTSRARVIQELWNRDRRGAFRVFHPQTVSGTAIYVHAKVVLADDRFIRVGSSNISNRSMGFDSECDICIDAEGSAQPHKISSAIANIRDDLLGEHLGCEPLKVGHFFESERSLARTIEHFDRSGQRLRPYETPDLDAVQDWLAENDILDPHGKDAEYPDISLN